MPHFSDGLPLSTDWVMSAVRSFGLLTADGGEILSTRLDRQSGQFTASLVFTGPLGDLTEIFLSGSIDNFEPVARISTTVLACDALLDASSSSDPDDVSDLESLAWYDTQTKSSLGVAPQLVLGEGHHEISLIAMDRQGALDRADAVIDVINNHPVAVITGATTYECSSPQGAMVSLSAESSYHPDGVAIVRYAWLLGPEPIAELVGEEPSLQIVLPLGEHGITLEVEDECGKVSDTAVRIVVDDTTPPEVIFEGHTGNTCLWPPNHDYTIVDVPQDIQTHALDLCDPNPVITFVDAISDQPDNGLGDGDTTQDLVVKDGYFCARAERSGVEGERVYTVTVAARDASGNVGRDGVVHVRVAHDQRDHDCPNLGGVEGVDEGDPRCQPDNPQRPDDVIADRPQPSAPDSPRLGCSQHAGAPGWATLLVVIAIRRRRDAWSRQ